MDLMQSTDIWVLISFVIFVYIAFRFGKTAFLAALDGRIEKIRQDIDTAESLRIEAKELLAQYQRKQRDADKEAKQIIETAKTHAEEIKKQAEKDLKELAKRREAQLQERLKRMEENAVNDIRAYAADLAIKATTETIAAQMNKKTNENLIDESIKAIGGKKG